MTASSTARYLGPPHVHCAPLRHAFAQYTVTSKTYDTRRVNPNPEVYLGAASLHVTTPLREQRLLDLGSGTGSFLEVMKPHFKEVCGVEYNEGMLEQAVARLGEGVDG